jgi:hypothetical protein
MATKAEKLASIEEKQKKLAAQKRALEAKDKLEQRKADTRLKVLVGAAVLSEISDDDERRLRSLLDRAIKAPRDREFLAAQGWLNGPAPNSAAKPAAPPTASAATASPAAQGLADKVRAAWAAVMRLPAGADKRKALKTELQVYGFQLSLDRQNSFVVLDKDGRGDTLSRYLGLDNAAINRELAGAV